MKSIVNARCQEAEDHVWLVSKALGSSVVVQHLTIHSPGQLRTDPLYFSRCIAEHQTHSMLQVLDETGQPHPILGTDHERLFILESLLKFSYNDVAVRQLPYTRCIADLRHLKNWNRLRNEVERLEELLSGTPPNKNPPPPAPAIGVCLLTLEDLLIKISDTVSNSLMNAMAASPSFRSGERLIYRVPASSSDLYSYYRSAALCSLHGVWRYHVRIP